MRMKTEELALQRDGLTLRGFQTVPDAGSYDVAVLFHGFLTNCGRDADSLILALSNALNARGIATVRVDFNGHGISDGSLEDMSVLSELLDASRVLRYARTLPGARRLFVHGQSQGGVIASIIAGIYPDWVDALALTAPAATMIDDARAGRLMDAAFDPDTVPERVTALGHTVGGFYLRTNQKLPIYEWAGNYRGPVCLIHAEGDTTVDKRASVRYHETYQKSDLHILPGGNHPLSGAVRASVLKLVCDFFEQAV